MNTKEVIPWLKLFECHNAVMGGPNEDLSNELRPTSICLDSRTLVASEDRPMSAWPFFTMSRAW